MAYQQKEGGNETWVHFKGKRTSVGEGEGFNPKLRKGRLAYTKKTSGPYEGPCQKKNTKKRPT